MYLVDLVAKLPQLRELTDNPRKYARWLINQYAPRANGGANHSLVHMNIASEDTAAASKLPGIQAPRQEHLKNEEGNAWAQST